MESTEKKKPYVAMRKIANYRGGLRDTEKGKAARNIYTLFAFEKENGIAFSCRHGSKGVDGMDFRSFFGFTLSLRENKKGEKKFYFYKIYDGGVRLTSPNRMRSHMEITFSSRKKKGCGIPKAQTRRLLSVVRNFLKKHNVPYKGLSSDPFSLMYQLCYPGSRSFDPETLPQLGCSRYLLNDPVTQVLRTKGKLSRKLLYGAIKAHPAAAHTTLTVARHLRINRSLDHAQQFLKDLCHLKDSYGERFFDPPTFWSRYSLTKLKSREWKVFDRLEVGEFIQAMRLNGMVRDVFTMLDQVGGMEGFNTDQLQYRTLRELHDQLSDLTNRKIISDFSDFPFEGDGYPMKLCALLKEKMQGKYRVTYAKDTDQLRNQARKMHNCSFSYYPRIQSGQYAIFCVNDEFMFGVHIFEKGDRIELDQAVTFCNRSIDKDTLGEILEEIDKALGYRQFIRRQVLGWG